MKKAFFGLLLASVVSITASAQTEVKRTDKKVKMETPATETKIKKTSTPKQKVHNAFHPKRKHYNGVKVKREVKTSSK